MTFKKLLVALAILAFAGLSAAPPAAAQSSVSYPSSPSSYSTPTSPSSVSQNNVAGLTNPLGKVTGICQLLKIVLNIAMLLGVPIAMLFIVYAGFRLVLARGNPEELKKARLNLLWTIIGIAIFIGVWTFVNILANTLGALGVSILGDCQ